MRETTRPHRPVGERGLCASSTWREARHLPQSENWSIAAGSETSGDQRTAGKKDHQGFDQTGGSLSRANKPDPAPRGSVSVPCRASVARGRSPGSFGDTCASPRFWQHLRNEKVHGAGFVSGFLLIVTAGLVTFDNYEYFVGSDGLPGVIGIIVILGCTILGAFAPWLPRKS